MTHHCEIVLVLIAASCAPYPHQLGLITPPPTVYGPEPAQPVSGALQPLYRVRSQGGALYPNVLCFGPAHFDVLQGPIGALVWQRSAAFGFDIEAVVEPALSGDDLQKLTQVVPPSLPPPLMFVPCPLEILRISPLAELPFDVFVSFAYARNGENTDVMLVRITAPAQYRSELVKMVSGSVGITFDVSYRISGNTELQNAALNLRSSSSIVSPPPTTQP
jgi:hypothetical protein